MLRSIEPYVRLIRSVLSRQREIPSEVLAHIRTHYLVEIDDVENFFSSRISTFDEFEIDKIFFPILTPTLKECAEFSSLIEDRPISKTEACLLPEAVFEQSAILSLLIQDISTTIETPAPLQAICYYIDLLYLDHRLPIKTTDVINQYAPKEYVNILKALIRCTAFDYKNTIELFHIFLPAVIEQNEFSLEIFKTFLHLLLKLSKGDFKQMRAVIQKELIKRIGNELHLEMVQKILDILDVMEPRLNVSL